MAHPKPEAIRAFVSQLPEQAARSLHHVLRCSMCRDVALADWADPDPVKPGQKPPGFWRGRKKAEVQLAELLQLEPKPREVAIRETRFHKQDLLDLILAKSEEAQSGDPRLAKDLAWLAIGLMHASGYCIRLWRGYSLAGNASRLQGARADRREEGVCLALLGLLHTSAVTFSSFGTTTGGRSSPA